LKQFSVFSFEFSDESAARTPTARTLKAKTEN